MQVFGKYRLVEPVAAGGMAEVWRAEAPGAEGFVKEVALKLIRGDHDARGDFVRMFIQEARLASRLSHANIVQVFDFDQVDGQYYIAMEMVRGRTLREIVERCREMGVRLGVPRAVHVGAEIARALGYAHRLEDAGRPAGIVHRDVSPQNVLVSFEGEVKLTDFGIARALGAAEVTAPGTIKGKLAYMAPEQARGEPVDGRADIFAAGVLLWELCAGRRLFARDGEAATLTALLGSDPVSPPSAWNEAVTPELDATVLAALERDPARRTASAEELADSLASIRLRVAARHEDLDLRALMRRLWPEGDTPASRRAAEPTVRRPTPSGAPAIAERSASMSDGAATTRTAARAPRTVKWRRRRWALAAVAAGALAVGGTALRGGRRAGEGRGSATSTPTPTSGTSASQPPYPRDPSSTASAPAEPSQSRAPAPGRDGTRPGVRRDERDQGSTPTPVSPSPSPPARKATSPTRPPRTPSRAGASARAAPSSGDAFVSVAASPWGYVFIDGVNRGETPIVDVGVAPGRHVVRVVNPGVGADEAAIELEPGRHWTWKAKPHR